MSGNRQAFSTAMNAADRYRWDSQWAEAAREYQRALVEFPADATARGGLGFCYMQLKQWQQALNEYKTVVKQDQYNVIALAKVAELYSILNRRDDAYATYLRMADLYSQAGQGARAEAAWLKAVQLSPNEPVPHERLAAYYLGKKDFTSMIQERLAAAQGYLQRKELAAARIQCEEVLRTDPHHVQAQQLLLLIAGQKQEAALPAWLEALRTGTPLPAQKEPQKPANDKAQPPADALLDKGALPSWMRAVQPEKPAVLIDENAIPAWMKVQPAEKPASLLDQSALPSWMREPLPVVPTPAQPPVPKNKAQPPRKRITANQVTGALRQAQTFQTLGRFNDAIDLCEQILEDGFDRADTRYFLGWLYQEQQRWDNAIQQFQLLLNDADYALSCFYALGQCYRAKGDIRTAIVHFDEAVDRVNLDALTIEEAPQLIQLCQESVEAHLAVGERGQAITVYTALLGYFRKRGWNDHIATVEGMLQRLQHTPASPKTPVPPPAQAANAPLTPPENPGIGELPDWLTGILYPDKVNLVAQVQKPVPPPEPVVVDSDNKSQGSLSSTQLPANTILKARYRILERLGKGGMGAVYKAKDADLNNRFVAVKQMRQQGLTPDMLLMYTNIFKSEANFLAMLMHPNLPRIYEHFFEGECWYLVMDYIDGSNLQDRLEQAGGRLPLEEALRIAIDLCTVLDYLHNRQPPIIFRDLKPSNVMLTSQGHLYLIDFGIARQFKPEQVKDTHHFQTVGYAAPEQFSQRATTPQSDIYSLGATLHQLLSGNDPAESAFDFPSLQVAIPTLTTLVQQMLEMRPINRPANMAVVKRELQRILAQVPLNVQPANTITPSPVQARPGYLRIAEGRGTGSVFELRKESTSIGRARESDIPLEDYAASRLHVTIIKQGNDTYTIKDEGSANGTKLNEQLVNKYQPYSLQEGDKFQVGQTIFIFTYQNQARTPLAHDFIL